MWRVGPPSLLKIENPNLQKDLVEDELDLESDAELMPSFSTLNTLRKSKHHVPRGMGGKTTRTFPGAFTTSALVGIIDSVSL